MKLKIALLFGGISNESDISIESAKSIINIIDKNKYDVYYIYIDKDGDFYKCEEIKDNNDIVNKVKIDNIVSYLKEFDLVFPVMHGIYGEDGTIQGFLETIGVKYVGCKLNSSSICMDKYLTRLLLKEGNINQTNYICIKKENDEYIYVDEELNEIKGELSNICKIIETKLKYPLFIKPCNSGSSIGINYANNNRDLIRYIEEASSIDNKIIIEENINGREVECGVLGNTDLIISSIGEVKTNNNFYSYNEKYNNNNFEIVIPSKLDDYIVKEIKRIAKKVYKLLGCKVLSRIDFFVEDKTNKIFVNEINTMPGFTNNSMFIKLFLYDGINNEELINRIIELSIKE